MAADTKIEWAHHTFNAWIGCTKVSPGCDHCYAERQDGHRRWTPEGWGGPRRRTGAEYWKQPLKWDRAAARKGERHRVFCSSLADVFDNQVDPAWRADLWALIAATPNLDWLLLTKRPQNIKKMLPPGWAPAGWPNVWLGTTVENQEEADRRIPHLLAVPTKVRFLSCEPLLGPVDLTRVQAPRYVPEDHDMDWKFSALETGDTYAFKDGLGVWEGGDGPYRMSRIDWVICGGESGPGARPMMIQWARALRDQCAAARVAFHFKQWGEFAPDDPAALRTSMVRVGKKAAGRLLDGVQHDGVPA